MTPFHIQRKFKASDRPNNIIDLGGKNFSGVSDSVIDRPFAIPWGVLVGREDTEAYNEESGKFKYQTLPGLRVCINIY
jgi:hypothetical protein